MTDIEAIEIREKGCEYCTGDIDDRPYLDGMKWYITGYGTLMNDETDVDEIEIKYCPMCGRPLKTAMPEEGK